MVSQALMERINALIERMGEPYKKGQDVPCNAVEGIHDRYVLRVLRLDDEVRSAVLDLLEKSHQENGGHGKIRQWARLCVGTASLLQYHEGDPYDRGQACDLIVRLGRWRHSRGMFYQRFVPWAQQVTALLFGDIEDLYGSFHR